MSRDSGCTQDASAVDLDFTPALQLQVIDGCSTGHKEIDLDLRPMMDQVRAAPFGHGLLERIAIEIEL